MGSNITNIGTIDTIDGVGGGGAFDPPASFMVNNYLDTQVNRGVGPSTFTSPTVRYVQDYSGALAPIAIDSPVFEGRRVVTNLYLYSDTLTTQNVTTSSRQYRVTFEGTGIISFTGTYTGSLVGGGAGVRKSVLFTATAGTLTSTVSGSVLFAVCEDATGTTNPSEYVSSMLYGSDVVGNNFSANITGWSGTNWAWSSAYGGSAEYSGAGFSALTGLTLTAGQSYKVTFTLHRGAVQLRAGLSGTPGLIYSTPGTYTESLRCVGSGTFYVFPQSVASNISDMTVQLISSASVTKYFDYENPYTVDGNGVVTDSGVRTPLPTTYRTEGVRIAPTGTNLINNAIAPATQSITVTAVPHTLSIMGVGSATLSGVATGSITGTSAVDIKTLTFTPTAGSLTVTLSGGHAITALQVEIGAQTSFMLSSAATTTRGASVDSYVTSDNLPASGVRHVSIVWTPRDVTAGKVQQLWSSYVSAGNYTAIWTNSVVVVFEKAVAGVSEYVTFPVTPLIGTPMLIEGYIYANNTLGLAVNGVLQSGTLGSEILTGLNLQSGWTLNGATALSATSYQRTGANGWAYKTAGVHTPHKFYTVSTTAVVDVGTYTVRNPSSVALLYTGNGSATYMPTVVSGTLLQIETLSSILSSLVMSEKEVLNNSTTLVPQIGSTMELGSLNGASNANGNFGPFKILSA